MGGDPFDTLGIRPEFDLDRSAIERAYLDRASRLHPDLAAGNEEAVRLMADVNRARRALDDPESRADALLRRLGGPAPDQEKGLPRGFLARMLAVREDMEAGLQQTHSDARSAARAQWERWSREQREEVIREASNLFAGLPPNPGSEALRAVRVHLNSWRYLERLIEQLDPAAHLKP